MLTTGRFFIHADPLNDSPLDALADLASHLRTKRKSILAAWREASERDPELTTASALSRVQFHDRIPEVLDAFERKLSAGRRVDKQQLAVEQQESAAAHGLHRWQQGYRLREVLREWRHLQVCLAKEVEQYILEHPDLDPNVAATARLALAELCGDGVCESADEYARLREAEAAARAHDLEVSIAELTELERRRMEVWREAAHDLNGNVGVMRTATALLSHPQVSDPDRTNVMSMLERSVASLQGMLKELMDLSRLEAGQEKRKIKTFDAAADLTQLCVSLQTVARERRLFLTSDGPETLEVSGDPVKVRRVAQNLLLNALKYTLHGGVKVTWGEDEADPAQRWVLCVQDTGPGVADGHISSLTLALEEATDEAQITEAKAEEAGDPSANVEQAPMLDSRSSHLPTPAPSGEGIGLSIVKRLCELLDAGLELVTEPGKGTTFRVTFPRRYPDA
jgi:signal transduction histidine kinase